MTPLPPHLDRLHDELMSAAQARAAAARRRPRPRLAAVVAFAVLATGGVALAATSTNPIDWLRGGDPQRELRIAPDDSRRIDGDFPRAILCPPGVDRDTAGCRALPGLECTTTTLPDGSVSESCTEPGRPAGTPGSPAGERRYELLNRVAERPLLTPALLRTVLADRDPEEILFPDAPARYRASVARVLELADRAPEDFWRGMNLLVSVQGGTISSGDPDAPGRDRVPPEGVRRFITCVDDAALRCRALTNGETLPIGAPMYSLEPDASWRSVPERDSGTDNFLELQREVFGREFTDDEQVLVAAMLMPLRASPGDGSGSTSAPAPEPAPAPVTAVETVGTAPAPTTP